MLDIRVHPLVLLSVLDHAARMKIRGRRRVAGMLMGVVESAAGPGYTQTVDVRQSFAVPFEETDDAIYIDDKYLEGIRDMIYKITPFEGIVGWYTVGDLRARDMDIHHVFQRYCQDPIYCVFDIAKLAQEHPVSIPIEPSTAALEGAPQAAIEPAAPPSARSDPDPKRSDTELSDAAEGHSVGPLGFVKPWRAQTDVWRRVAPAATRPLKVYVSRQRRFDGQGFTTGFETVPFAIHADEPEHIAIDHILRNDGGAQRPVARRLTALQDALRHAAQTARAAAAALRAPGPPASKRALAGAALRLFNALLDIEPHFDALDAQLPARYLHALVHLQALTVAQLHKTVKASS